MARISDAWDRATDVLAGRAGVLAPIAAAAFVLPAAIGGAVKAYGGEAVGAVLAGGLIGIAGVVASLWGHLAVVAVAGDPATTRQDAGRLAWRRLPAALLVGLILAGLVVALLVPAAIILLAGGFDLVAATTAAQTGGTMPSVSPVAGGLLVLYLIVLAAVALWVSARLYLLYPVVLNERLAAGAFARSLALTRGLTGQLIAVTLLLGVAGLVAAVAAQSVVGIVARLVIGAGPTAGFAAGLASSLVTAAWVVVVQVFAARLYALVAAGRAPVPLA